MKPLFIRRLLCFFFGHPVNQYMPATRDLGNCAYCMRIVQKPARFRKSVDL